MNEFAPIEIDTEFCVVGGGLAGMCAAVAAARHGVRTVLVHDRPVPGGNASGEIRMWVCGAHGEMETGIIEELRLRNLERNPDRTWPLWDLLLYELVKFQPGLTLLLNASCNGCEMEGNRIRAVRAWQLTTQKNFLISAELFADCSGDSVLAPLSGAEYRMGREARHEYGESIAPERADRCTMGMSCLMQAREAPGPVPFVPVPWARKITQKSVFDRRSPAMDRLNNFWWLELGGTRDTIADTEEIRDELLALAMGTWEYIKRDPGCKARNWGIDWLGFLPGKRESRRYVGDLVMTENDVAAGGRFPDTVAYGGWTMDDHFPEGFDHPGAPNIFHPAPSPFGISYRTLYSRNVENLFCAGRNISTTHSALSATRVMATCALLGQAVGTAAAVAVREHLAPRQVGQRKLAELQQMLMEDDCFLPGFVRRPPPETMAAHLSVSNSGDAEALRNGVDRIFGGRENCWHAGAGDRAEYSFDAPRRIAKLRITLDSDLKRNEKDHSNLNAECSFPLKPHKVEISPQLIEAFRVEAETAAGKTEVLYRVERNFQRFHHVAVDASEVVRLRLVIEKVRQPGTSRVFAFDFESC